MFQGHSLSAVPLFERAIALDPNFAMAYEYLGIAFELLGTAAAGNIRKQAFQFDRPGFPRSSGTDRAVLLRGHWRVGQSGLTAIIGIATIPDTGIPQ